MRPRPHRAPSSARRIAALLVFALAWVAVPGTAAAQILKVGYIDSVKIFENYSFAKEAQQRFAREIEAWRRESDDRLRALEEQRAEFEEQKLLLSEEKRLEQENQIQKALSEYEQFVQAFWGPNGKASAMNEQLTAEVIQRVRDVVERIATEEGYDLVLDAADGNVIFAVRNLDLTDRVLQQLNQEVAGTSLPGTQP